MAKPRTPTGLLAPGRAFYKAVADVYDLEEHERVMLLEASRITDRLDVLDGILREEGPIITTPSGDRAHPALVESRQQSIVLARLVAALRLPSGDEADAARPQRRSGARGVYGIRAAV